MLDSLLALPAAPAGVEPAVHLRELLTQALRDMDWLIKELHEQPMDGMEREAADASTDLRELRQAARMAVEHELDEEEPLVTTVGLAGILIERGEHVINAVTLRSALDDDAAWDQVMPNALAICELAGSQYMGYLSDHSDSKGRLTRAETSTLVPTRDALMRSMVAGVLQAQTKPLPSSRTMEHFEQLLEKVLPELEPFQVTDPLRHLRCARVAGIALWNLTRIAQRTMSPGARSAVAAARTAQLAPIYAAVEAQRRVLGETADFEHSYDVGLAYGTVAPKLTQIADKLQATMPRRANPITWLELFSQP